MLWNKIRDCDVIYKVGVQLETRSVALIGSVFDVFRREHPVAPTKDIRTQF